MLCISRLFYFSLPFHRGNMHLIWGSEELGGIQQWRQKGFISWVAVRVLLLLHHQLLTTWMIYESVTVWLHISFCYISIPISKNNSKNYHSPVFEQEFGTLLCSCKWEKELKSHLIVTTKLSQIALRMRHTDALNFHNSHWDNEGRHSVFPEMEKSSSFSALINYRYIADSATRSRWRVRVLKHSRRNQTGHLHSTLFSSYAETNPQAT